LKLVHHLVVVNQSAIKTTIKRASKKAQTSLHVIDARARKDVRQIYQTAADQIRADIEAAAVTDGTVQIDAMKTLLNQVNGKLDALSNSRGDLLESTLRDAATLGSSPFAASVAASTIVSVNHDAVTFVSNLIANDGLQLSDRIFRVDRHGREAVASAIQQAVIQGKSAADAAMDFLTRGEQIPPELLAKMNKAQASRIAREAGSTLMSGDGNPMANAMRLFRTEINRAHGEAYEAAAFEHPDTIGTKFLLSPNHPRPDICDMHARVNRYGLGPGVYPKGRNPWPAHPNTLSFTVVVFRDEVSKAERAGKETRIDFIKAQPPARRAAILGGHKKRAAFDAGHIDEGQIASTWANVEKSLKRKGVNVESLLTGAK